MDDRNKNGRNYPIGNSGIVESDGFCYTLITLITITITITYKNIYPSKYTEYQQYLYDRIKGYKECFVTPIGWKQMGEILTSEGLKTPLGKIFKSNNVFSIYKKGKIREQRLNSKRSVTRSLEVTHYSNNDIELLL